MAVQARRLLLGMAIAALWPVAACDRGGDSDQEPGPLAQAEIPEDPVPVPAPQTLVETPVAAPGPVPPAPPADVALAVPEPAAPEVAPPALDAAAVVPEPVPLPDAPVVTPPPAPEGVPAAVAPPASPPPDPPPDLALLARIAGADAAEGGRLAEQCGLCHTFGDGERAYIGPNLYNIVNAAVARSSAFPYSAPMRALGAGGATWSYDRLDAFIAGPAALLPGTTMAITGVADQRDRANLIAYLRSLSLEPAPLPPGRIGQVVEGLDAVVFTAAQAAEGRFQYRVCTPCHHESLLGEWHGSRIGYAPPLAGGWFAQRWYDQSIGAFVARFRSVILFEHDGPEDHGQFSPETYSALVAYILEHNGFVPGDTLLPTDGDALARLGFWQ